MGASPSADEPAPALDAGTALIAAPVNPDAGSKPAPALDGDGGAADGGQSCECHLSGSKSCHPIATACSVDSDCAADFRCSLADVAVAACDPQPNAGASAACQMGAAPPSNSGTCTPRYNGDTKSGGAPEGATPADHGSGGTTAATPPTTHGDAGVDDGAGKPPAAHSCSVSTVGAGRAPASAFVMLGMLMLGLRLGRPRKRG